MVTVRRVLFVSAILTLCASPNLSAMTIAKDRRAEAIIVVRADASEPERYAAQELANFLEQVTGAEFMAVTEVVRPGPCIFVGPDAAKQADPQFSTDGLGAEGIVLKTIGDNLILAGGRPRGTLYAVYTFLEDQLGCRWWSSTECTIPKKPTVSVDKLDVRYIPPLEYRSPFWTDAFEGNWSARNKANGQSHNLEVKHGGKHIYEGFVHTFFPLIPPEKYFADHPEWFSEIDGKRKHEHAQLCLTNEEMRQELVKNLKQNLRNNPEATIASVSQNDWHGNCQCAKCAAIEQEEGSPAGLMLRFLNAVAADIEQEFPNVALSTLAYQYTRKPPKITKPRPNVIVQLCSIECSFCKPLADERNKAFRDDIVGWSKISKRLYIWDYTTNFRHYILPHPNLRVLGPNVKFFADHNVTGIFEQGAYTSYGAEMAELRAWVLAKLLWDPTRDGDALVNEFIEGYYGPAAPSIKAYLKTMHDAVEASGDWLGCFEQHTARFLSFENLARGWQHLQAAEQAVAGDPDLRFRVQVAELPVMYTFIMRWKQMREDAKAAGAEWPMPETIKEACDQFMVIAKKKNVTRLNEWQDGFVALDTALAQNP
ncbi:MAG TPA: DUF4838 domain-containing protein [Sedimentisphaerales bacterium]|jgi:hypothetical protein|nr:DUF4838 domain-containing protein [Sedimentisphaerales bacterium]HNU28029.1 DUF4838 domain-containing protein [Sedimentisphaerales bacterium]